MTEYVPTKIEWFDKKRNLKGAIRKAKEVQCHIHDDYFQRISAYNAPRHKLTIQFAVEFAENCPDDMLPGLATISVEPLIYLLIPRAWKDDYANDFNIPD